MKTRLLRYLIIGFALFQLMPVAVKAQVDHYWSQQFGAVSTLTGGAMIAGVRDNSASFYNPGGLAYIEFPNLSVDGNIYKLDKIKLSDGGGTGINLNSAQMSIFPSILAGMISYVKVPGLKLSWSILTKNYNNVLMSTRYAKEGSTPSITGSDQYLGELDYVNQLNEQWFGLCLSYRLLKNLGIGITNFGTYRGETSSITNNSREVLLEGTNASMSQSNSTQTMKYVTVGTLFKVGIDWELKHWRFGLTVTTPSILLYGNGSTRREDSYYSTFPAGTSGQQPYMIRAENKSADAKYRHPWSFGLGVEFRTEKTRIAFSAEYFLAIKSYNIMSPDANPMIYPASLKDSAQMQTTIGHYLYYSTASKPVLNAGIGLDQMLGKSFSLLLGARTDFSSYTPTEDARVMTHGTGQWDLYYVSTGLSYHRPKQIITLGFTYGFSLHKHIDPIAIITPGSSPEVRSGVFAQSFGIVLGYTYFFPR
jgi:hypothetical protein